MTEKFNEFETASFLAYGETKNGKSTLLSTMPTPGVIFDTEGKWQFFQGRPNPNRDGKPFRLKLWNPSEAPPEDDGSYDFAIVKVTHTKVMVQGMQWIDRTNHPFTSIGLDSLTVGQEQGIGTAVNVFCKCAVYAPLSRINSILPRTRTINTSLTSTRKTPLTPKRS